MTYHVPTTVAELRSPKPVHVITEAANFQRAHWEELTPIHQILSGEAPSSHKAYWLEAAAYTFKVQDMVRTNGYANLGQLTSYDLWRALKFGFKRNTGMSMRLLEKQYRQGQITHQGQSPDQQ